MKNKKQTILIISIIAILIIVCIIVVIINNNKGGEQIGKNTTKTITKVEPPQKELPDETANLTLYIGQNEAYTQISAKYNENANKQDQVKRILEKIGLNIGYKIEINSATVTNEKIVIDFKGTSAPFNDSAYFGGEEEGLFISDYAELVYTVFDSIQVTLKNVFGENVDIYYTVDGSGMRFNNIVPNLTIDENIPYKK